MRLQVGRTFCAPSDSAIDSLKQQARSVSAILPARRRRDRARRFGYPRLPFCGCVAAR